MKNFILIAMIFFCSSSFAQNDGIIFSQLDSNHIIVPNNTAINVTNNFTIEFWMKPARIVGDWLAIATEGKCSNALFSYYIAINPDSLMNFRFCTDGVCDNSSTYVCNTKLFPSVCYHVAISYSAAGVKIYLNGILQPGQYTIGSYSGNLYSSNESLIISAYKFLNGTLGSWYYGLIDEFRIWNRVLTPSEILANYLSPLAGNETGLVLYYKFDNMLNGPGIIVTNSATITGLALNGLTYSNTSSTPSMSQSCFSYVNVDENVSDPPGFSIFPNPTGGKCLIKSDDCINKIEVYNTLGENVLNNSEMNINTSVEIDLTGFHKGLYLLKIYSSGEVKTKKICVE